MTNTTNILRTATGVTCGRCSIWDHGSRVEVKHPTVADVRACFIAPVVPVLEVPAPAQVEELFTTHEAAPLARHFAKCPRKGCGTVKVRNHPHLLRCYNHGKVVKIRSKQLFGTLSTADKHKCNSSCTGAVGPVCTCSCAGANHGVDHLIGV